MKSAPVTTVTFENSVLKEMLETGFALDINGNRVKMHSQISVTSAEALYQSVLANKPTLVVEVGMAFGVSTLAILSALRQIGKGGRLISIDPNQSTDWKGAGISNVARAGLQHHHELITEPSFAALPRLLGAGCRPEFGYIDGWHTFDYTLLDFWYIDRMMAANGVIGFNDCGYPAVHKAINFVLCHRRYEEISVGLKPIFSRKREMTRFFRGRYSKRDRVLHQDRYFKKIEDWEPGFDYFRDF